MTGRASGGCALVKASSNAKYQASIYLGWLVMRMKLGPANAGLASAALFILWSVVDSALDAVTGAVLAETGVLQSAVVFFDRFLPIFAESVTSYWVVVPVTLCFGFYVGYRFEELRKRIPFFSNNNAKPASLGTSDVVLLDRVQEVASRILKHSPSQDDIAYASNRLSEIEDSSHSYYWRKDVYAAINDFLQSSKIHIVNKCRITTGDEYLEVRAAIEGHAARINNLLRERRI